MRELIKSVFLCRLTLKMPSTIPTTDSNLHAALISFASDSSHEACQSPSMFIRCKQTKLISEDSPTCAAEAAWASATGGNWRLPSSPKATGSIRTFGPATSWPRRSAPCRYWNIGFNCQLDRPRGMHAAYRLNP